MVSIPQQLSRITSRHIYTNWQKTRFNPIVPPLTIDYATKKIMHAILVRTFVF